jgi:hypothetical protein
MGPVCRRRQNRHQHNIEFVQFIINEGTLQNKYHDELVLQCFPDKQSRQQFGLGTYKCCCKSDTNICFDGGKLELNTNKNATRANWDDVCNRNVKVGA